MTSQTTTERQVTQAQLERLADWSMRKPVIALMGEFSAGKSTLMNLLIGQDILPTQITATRMPPVWLTYGDAPPYRMDQDGKKHKVDPSRTDRIPITTTRYIRLYVKADILKNCDLIDTPGISDPHIKTSYWLNTIRYANAVMWCTHAGQAWRESERGAWEGLPLRLRETSILLVTRKDKITSERDLAKIRRRLERETTHLFNARMFVSLTNAIKARAKGDAKAWTESGAEEFAEMLEKIVEGIYVQRSYLLARYLTDDGAKAGADVKAASGVDTNNMLGFVGSVAAEEAPRDTASLLDDIMNSVGAIGDDQVLGDTTAEEEAAMMHGTDEDTAETPSLDEPEPPVFKTPRADANINDYRLSDPSAYRGEQSRVDLTNYRLKNPSQAEEPEEPSTLSIAEQAALLQAIWNDAQEQHDLSDAPQLVSAMRGLIAQMQAQAEADTTERRTA
ncbi:dynamin family protein [Cognatiyoonia sp. IB215446]|uniref:dynamin family protein n=1 Tax=Cognatiyoonia sp. IB215446 TaxID=3097355 RepID=UPI002A1196A1|nr:dynamin family protein [Cognatiyoonia sp. IB215446]MDX8346928.1 dynamin family protein [Cognatiyoonia sp. IB215446]